MDIFDNIKNNVYEADKSELEKIAAYVICVCETKYPVKSSKTPNFCPKCGFPILGKVDEAIIKNKEIKDGYNKEVAGLHQQFKEDLFEYYGIKDNPKREKAYEYAWNRNQDGMYDVVNIMGDLIDLIE
jgi:hypothetical protein